MRDLDSIGKFCSVIFVLWSTLPEKLQAEDDAGAFAISPKHRIVGGSEAIPHEFPWIVLLRFTGNSICSGSILNEKLILTAAHCCQSPVDSYRITAGVHNKNVLSGKEQVSHLETIVVHPKYNPETFQNDIALLKLKTEFRFTSSVKPISLVPSEFLPTAGTPTVVAGWGSRKYKNNQGSNLLRKVLTPIVDLKLCRRQYRGIINISDSHICTGQPGRSSCSGDSGSPLLCFVSKGLVGLCGLVSGAKGCGQEHFPQVNVNVQHYSQWINDTISNEENYTRT